MTVIEKETLRQKTFENYGTLYLGDVLACATQLPSNSVDCVITSPPYWQLRDYGYTGQWGLEPTYQEYLAHLQSLMKELYRIVKPEGTVWINLGDTYSNKSMGSFSSSTSFNKNCGGVDVNSIREIDLPQKCLMLIPHRYHSTNT